MCQYKQQVFLRRSQASTLSFFCLSKKDTGTGEEGAATTYARTDHTYHENVITNIKSKEVIGTRTAGTANVYSSSTHQHPLNIDPTVSNIQLVNATAAANGKQL
ncbi:MAG: hypothetical protein EZS28_030446 [Streblomastix strix]|uniref:Uncharacterized protein n=1 Tax=Streblomastix strix TaxID=222440 RepID=A0A5J4UUF7_9EUKA|nr:MAG: hypothetical protein EZS28_030446 [Streblomastix strix]